MTPMVGQQVYSKDGTEWLGTIDSGYRREYWVWNAVRLTGQHKWLMVFEWDRSLGGWLQL